MTLQLAPSLSVTKDVLFKAAFAGLPLVAMFRMLSVDFLRGFLPVMTFVIWIGLQTDRLARRDHIRSILTDPEQQELTCKKETLAQGMTKGEPLYWWGVTFEVLIFAEAAANIAVELWWWLHGASQAGWFRIGAALLAFVVAVVSWRYVKAANRAAAAALQSAIDAKKAAA